MQAYLGQSKFTQLVCLSLLCLSTTAVHGATIAYWQFDSNDPTGGTILTASVGAGIYTLTNPNGGPAANAGTAVNPVPNPDTTVGFVGNPAVNNGSVSSPADTGNTYLRTAGNGTSALNLVNNQWTFEGWFNHAAASGTSFDILFSTREASTGFTLDIRNTNLFNLFVFDGLNSSGDQNFGSSTTISTGANVWHHFALTYNSALGVGVTPNGRFQMFLDGTALGTYDLAATINRANVDASDLGYIAFLGRPTTGVNSFNGRADEWRISNTVLTPNQFLNYVPEPSSAFLAAFGAFAMFVRRHRDHFQRSC